MMPSGLLTWVPVGTDGVTLRMNAGEKDSVTVPASIKIDGEKLLLFAIAKGKTTKADQSQPGTNGATIKDHSPSRWTTVETFRPYLDSLSGLSDGRIPPRRQIHLILDCCSVHRSREITQYARRLGIKLWFIPAGLTDEL
jgi:hypothetical protein